MHPQPYWGISPYRQRSCGWQRTHTIAARWMGRISLVARVTLTRLGLWKHRHCRQVRLPEAAASCAAVAPFLCSDATSSGVSPG